VRAPGLAISQVNAQGLWFEPANPGVTEALRCVSSYSYLNIRDDHYSHRYQFIFTFLLDTGFRYLVVILVNSGILVEMSASSSRIRTNALGRND
jgi:hypothetical protein